MAPDDHSGAKPAGPVVLRIKLRYDDLDAMVQKFASNVGKSGLFVPTKSIQPVGTEVKFELRLTNDVPVLVGLGRVKHVRPPDPANPKAAFGMAIELMRVSREGREVIIRMIERRRALGLPDVAIPLPDDAEAARRSEVETQPRSETSAVVRDAMAQLASASVAEPLLAAKPASGPIAVAKDPSGGIAVATEPSSDLAVGTQEPRRPSAPLLTAPRASSGAIPVAPLAPERSRPRRPRVQELIDRAAELSAPIIAALPTPELDMHVDVDSVLSRARALAGGELEAELATLREAAAAPLEITVEAASAELARQLGGKAIAKRERSGSARWAPPPAVAELRAKTPVVVETPEVQNPPAAEQPADAGLAEHDTLSPDFSTRTRAETEAAPAATIAAAVEAAIEASASAFESSPSIVPQESYVIRAATPTSEQSYEDAMADEAEEAAGDATPVFARDDYDDAFVPNVTTTTAVDDPLDPGTEKPRRFASTPDVATEPTGNRALMIDDDADLSSFERALDAARVHTGVSTVAPTRPDDRELEDDPGDELLASGEYQLADDGGDGIVDAPNERTQTGALGAYPESPSIPDQLAAQLDQQLAEAEAEAERDLADGLANDQTYAADQDEEEEISELDVLAEADEEDADLLAGHGDTISPPMAEADGYDTIAPPLEQSQYAAPVDDFAARLDLGDDDEPLPSEEFDRQAAREFDAAVPAHGHGVSAADYRAPAHDTYAPRHDYVEPMRPVIPPQAAEPSRVPRYRRPSSEFPDPPSSSYTFAENYPQAGLQLGPDNGAADELDEPLGYAPAPEPMPRPVGPDPRLLRYGRATTASTEDLEDALAALDVDLDELANLDQRRPRRPTPSSVGPRPLPGLPIERSRDSEPPARSSHPPTNPPRGANPLPRSSITGKHATARAPAPTTGSHPVAKSATGPAPAVRSSTGQVRITKPPPIPAAARRPPTQQVPIANTPSKRASTDEGVLIDFDDDE